MATIDYKEKYEKAVQAAILAKQDTESAVTIGILEEIFPELKESEDERMRKRLMEWVEEFRKLNPTNADHNAECSEALAWLEKQGKITKEWSEMKMNNIQTGLQEMVDLKLKTEQGEQKPAWSEEDEMFVHGLIRGLAAKRDIHGHTTFSSDCIDITETINWLKSLKDRVQPQNRWKPSEEQIEALHDAIIYVKDSMFPSKNVLKKLYGQLKKLREE